MSALSRRELHMRLSRESSQATPFPRFFSHLVDSLSLVCWRRARPRDLFLRPSCASVPYVGRFHCFRLCDTAAFPTENGRFVTFLVRREVGACARRCPFSHATIPGRVQRGVAACTVAVLFFLHKPGSSAAGPVEPEQIHPNANTSPSPFSRRVRVEIQQRRACDVTPGILPPPCTSYPPGTRPPAQGDKNRRPYCCAPPDTLFFHCPPPSCFQQIGGIYTQPEHPSSHIGLCGETTI